MKPTKPKIQPHKLALRRETIAVLAAHRLAQVVGGEREGTHQSDNGCLQHN